MRLRLAAGTSELLETSKEWFAKLAREHGREVFKPTPIRRLYATEKERAVKARRATEPEYAKLASEDFVNNTINDTANDTSDIANAPLGSFFINGGGWVDLPLLLDLEAEWLRQRGALIEGVIREEMLRVCADGGVEWNGWRAQGGAVFCNGWLAGCEASWAWLPWQPAKGEIVDYQTNIADAPWILNRGGWAIPLGNGIWRSGSTWEWKLLDNLPTPAAAELLRTRLQTFFSTPIDARLVQHRAGVRPCVLGNEPLCGTHPQKPHLHLFSGLGPKGTFWGPACAIALSEWLCNKTPLPKRFDLRRMIT
jgi:glycine/D-amino acid oxidase-like deaminating enzyme